MIEFRQAEAADARIISDLLAELGYPATVGEIPERLAAIARFPTALAIVATSDGQVAGLITAHIIPVIHAEQPMCMITALVVSHDYRGKGIGSALVERAEVWAAENGASKVSVASGMQRTDTHQFYERRGYGSSGLRFTKLLD